MRVLIPGLTAIRFIGEGKPNFRGKPHGRKYVTVERGDILIVDEIVAIQQCRGTQYERVKGVDLDIAPLFRVVEPIEIHSTLKDEATEVVEPRIMTKQNLDEFSDEELIAFAKSKKITGVTKRTSRRKIIPRILAFLPDE